jgi:hypothetical protein
VVKPIQCQPASSFGGIRIRRTVAAAPYLSRELSRVDTNHSENRESGEFPGLRMSIQGGLVGLKQLSTFHDRHGGRPLVEDFENVTHFAPLSDQETSWQACLDSRQRKSFRPLKQAGNQSLGYVNTEHSSSGGICWLHSAAPKAHAVEGDVRRKGSVLHRQVKWKLNRATRSSSERCAQRIALARWCDRGRRWALTATCAAYR